MAQSIIDGDAEAAEALAKQSIAAGIDPLDAINQGFVVGVNTVGDAFARGDAFLPELVMAGGLEAHPANAVGCRCPSDICREAVYAHPVRSRRGPARAGHSSGVIIQPDRILTNYYREL